MFKNDHHRRLNSNLHVQRRKLLVWLLRLDDLGNQIQWFLEDFLKQLWLLARPRVRVRALDQVELSEMMTLGG